MPTEESLPKPKKGKKKKKPPSFALLLDDDDDNDNDDDRDRDDIGIIKKEDNNSINVFHCLLIFVIQTLDTLRGKLFQLHNFNQKSTMR